MIILGDCLTELRSLGDETVDSVVTDPPYGLSFMGKKWDYDVPGVEIWEECFRVLKPGGHLLAFFGSRTYHRGVIPIEDAGFEIRDQVMWVYGSGFPKSHNISKAIDRAAKAEREVVATYKARGFSETSPTNDGRNQWAAGKVIDKVGRITTPATPEAKKWDGWGTALKPAHEPIVVARKPVQGTVAENVLQFSTGGINIDGCRVETNEEITNHSRGKESAISKGKYGDSKAQETHQTEGQTLGRFPANVIHDGSQTVLNLFPDTKSGADCKRKKPHETNAMAGTVGILDREEISYGDKGSAARFFYCAKASKKDRGENNHPTVKPTDLMRYLCRLVTPPGGVVLDPFMGSGSTGKAAQKEGFEFIGIEREPEYVEIARQRI